MSLGLLAPKRIPQVGLVAEHRYSEQTGQTLTDFGPKANLLQLGSTSGVDTNDPTWDGEGLTFDGVDNYCRQPASDTQQGVLTYQGNDTTTAEFRDTLQDFSTWQSSGKAAYMIVVTNSDSTISWGYLGSANNGLGTNDDVDIYSDITLTTRGWKGTAPIAGGKTASTYEVRKSDFQITTGITVGCWAKKATLSTGTFLAKRNTLVYSWELDVGIGPVYQAKINSNGSLVTSTKVTTNWTFIVMTFDGNNIGLFVDGILEGYVNWSSTINDSSALLTVGKRDYLGAESYYNGQIAYDFILDRALMPAEVYKAYHVTRQKLRMRGIVA